MKRLAALACAFAASLGTYEAQAEDIFVTYSGTVASNTFNSAGTYGGVQIGDTASFTIKIDTMPTRSLRAVLVELM